MVIILIVLLAVVPLVIKSNAEFGGSDDQAEGVIEELDPGYKPWAAPVMEPKSGEVESLLFALQAALGAGVIGYYLGYARREKKKEDPKK